MSQTYESIEYIFVDDASTDNSIYKLYDVLKIYPHRNTYVKVVKHEKNRGLPNARNSGLNICTGTYVFHCDSDDWIENNMIDDMVKLAIESQADIVYADFYLTFLKSEGYMKQSEIVNNLECISAMLRGNMKYNVWNKLIKRSLYKENDICFPGGRGMGEDMTMVKLFVHAKKVSYLHKAYYHYMQVNSNAFTKTYSEKHIDDVLYNANNLIVYLQKFGLGDKFYRDFQFFKLNLKLPYIITLNTELYDIWRNMFPEVNGYISLNPGFSTRIKILQYLAIWKQDWLIYLYNYFIYRIVYGIFYK